MTMNYPPIPNLLCLLAAATIVGCTPSSPTTTEAGTGTDTDTSSTTETEPPDPTIEPTTTTIEPTTTTGTTTTTEPTGTTDPGTETTETTAAPVNTPPTAPVVAIEPETPNRNDDLTCVITTESEDVDGDSVVYTFSWMVDGADAMIDTEVVTADLTDLGQEWECSATPNDGTDDGPAGTATAIVSPACVGIDFDGNDDYISAAHISSPTAWTIEAWVSPGDQAGQRALISQVDANEGFANFELGIENSKPYLIAADGADWIKSEWPNAISSGEWHHIAGAYDGTEAYIIVDGVVGPKVPSVFVEAELPLHIGGRPSESLFFDGKIFEVRISSTARYIEDFSPGFGWNPDADTLALWYLDEGEGAVVGDSSDNAIEGTINGEAAWVQECPST